MAFWPQQDEDKFQFMMKFISFVFTGKKVIRELRNGTIFVTEKEGNVSRYQPVETPKSATKNQFQKLELFVPKD